MAMGVNWRFGSGPQAEMGDYVWHDADFNHHRCRGCGGIVAAGGKLNVVPGEKGLAERVVNLL
jgi:hypothetical protein